MGGVETRKPALFPESQTTTGSVSDNALALYDAGFSIIPIRCDGSKQPALKSWKKFQAEPPEESTVRFWFRKRNPPGIAIVFGKVSGNAELLDADDHALWPEFIRRVFEVIPKLVDAPLVQTPEKGFHLIYRLSAPPPGNLKLAQRPDPQPDNPHGRRTLLETRGEGGYGLTIGSPAQCHPSGKTYTLISGGFGHVPVLTEEEHLRLHELAREYDQMPPITGELEGGGAVGGPSADGRPGPAAGARPGDDFNRRASWSELLERHRWRLVRTLGDVAYWKRPDKQEVGHSATTNYGGSDLLYIFSSNAAPFEPDRAYTKFAALALLEHSGDFSAAARRLAGEGYGWHSGATADVAPADEGTTGTAPAAVKFPFRLTTDGVFFAQADDKGTTKWVKVCSRLEIITTTNDEVSEDWGRLLRVPDGAGVVHDWAMPMSMLAGDGLDYRERLLSLGLIIEPGRKARERLHSYISTTMPVQRVRCVPRLGWHDYSVVLPDITYENSHQQFCGNSQSQFIYQAPYPLPHAFKTAGTLEQWQLEVAALCAGNSRLAFAVSCAFAAPLLYLTGEESGGFHLRDKSSTGKTTALRVAASVVGGNSTPLGFVRTWRATANGLEAIAALHCDQLLCLDELSQIGSKEAGESAYMLSNGIGKHRARRDGSARPPASWRVLFLSSGEITLADKIAEDGRRRATAGQQVRIVDIPADAGAGLGSFEKLHGQASGGAFADHLRAVSSQFYGTPIRAFVEKLVADPVGHGETVKKSCTCFVDRYCPRDADGQVGRVAQRFGLVATAGELAISFGILPWPVGEAERSARACFDAWLVARETKGPAEVEAGFAQVRKCLELHGSLASRRCAPSIRTKDRDGRSTDGVFVNLWERARAFTCCRKFGGQRYA